MPRSRRAAMPPISVQWSNRMSEFLQDALGYAARGWSIVPICLDGDRKTPAIKTWKKYQTERASDATLRRWFARPGVDGLAVVCGAVSGGLVVRDYDVLDSYKQWAAARPDLAAALPTVETARGRHVYFHHSTERDTRPERFIGGSSVYPMIPRFSLIRMTAGLSLQTVPPRLPSLYHRAN
jgi:hypothetical protein